MPELGTGVEGLGFDRQSWLGHWIQGKQVSFDESGEGSANRLSETLRKSRGVENELSRRF